MKRLVTGTEVTVDVPATSANLGPGFDCFGLALSWTDRVEVTVTGGGYQVEVSGEAADLVPRDETHLILQSALQGLADLGSTVPGLALRCHNTTRHGRGLGSSSAAIVAGLLAALTLSGEAGDDVDDDARRWLLRHADRIEGHPDNVAAAIHGGFVLVWRTATGLEVVRPPVHPEVTAAVLVPATPVATKAARGLLPETVPHADAARNAARTALLVHALGREPEHLLAGTADWLHQDYRRPAMPASWDLVQRLRAEGVAAVVSGAGPTVLVLGRAADLADLPAHPGYHRVDVAVGAAAAARSVDRSPG